MRKKQAILQASVRHDMLTLEAQKPQHARLGSAETKICVGTCLNPATVGNSSIQSIPVCEPYLPLLVTVIVVFRQGSIISIDMYIYYIYQFFHIHIYIYEYMCLFCIYSLLMFVIFTVWRRTFYSFIYKHMYLRTSTQWSVSTQLV